MGSVFACQPHLNVSPYREMYREVGMDILFYGSLSVLNVAAVVVVGIAFAVLAEAICDGWVNGALHKYRESVSVGCFVCLVLAYQAVIIMVNQVWPSMAGLFTSLVAAIAG